MTVTVANAQIYSMTGEMVYEIEYSEGTKVRVIEGYGIIRNEWKDGDEWKPSGKPYVVKKNKRRNAEVLKQTAIDFLKAK